MGGQHLRRDRAASSGPRGIIQSCGTAGAASRAMGGWYSPAATVSTAVNSTPGIDSDFQVFTRALCESRAERQGGEKRNEERRGSHTDCSFLRE